MSLKSESLWSTFDPCDVCVVIEDMEIGIWANFDEGVGIVGMFGHGCCSFGRNGDCVLSLVWETRKTRNEGHKQQEKQHQVATW